MDPPQPSSSWLPTASATGLYLERRQPLYPGDRLHAALPEPDAGVRVAPDVLDPTGGVATFGEKVELLEVDDEPLFRVAVPTDRGQMRHLLICQALECCGIHNGIAEDTGLLADGQRRASCY
jgi:hypothetical protein